MANLLSKGTVFSLCERPLSSICLNRRNPFFRSLSSSSIDPENSFLGKNLLVGTQKKNPLNRNLQPVLAVKMICKAQRWWQRGIQPNMKEINSAQDLSDSLLKSGDSLVIVDFFSPGCAGCKALHPKICQFAEKNPDIVFLQVNYEMHKSMCYSLNIHVLPFFRFYRGAHGRLCSFSCTNATIKKFKDALAKHSTERCSLGPARGLEESELLALSGNKDLCFHYLTKENTVLFNAPQIKGPISAIKMVSSSKSEFEDKAMAATSWSGAI